MTANLKNYLRGKEEVLHIRGDPSTQAISNLRKLESLGLLSDEMVWGLMGQTTVDPLYLIRLFRGHKAQLGFHPEEHHVGDTVAFLYGEKTKDGYKLSYHVNIYTNDITVMVCTPDGAQRIVMELAADKLYEQISKEQVGETRLQLLLSLVKTHIQTALH